MSAVGRVQDVDVATGIPAVPAARAGMVGMILVRCFTEPLGVVTETLPEGGLPATELARAIADRLEAPLRLRFERCGLGWSGTLPLDGVTPPETPPFLASRERVLRDGPEMTAVICTHNRPDGLRSALASLARQEYPRLRVLVVDNAPPDDRAREVASAFASSHGVRYVVEPRPGLSWARNRGLELVDTDVIAWVDDDETCDPWWAVEIARAFVELPAASAVTGAVVPSELETPSQLWFEEHGGVRRSRGFERAVFSPATRRVQSPLYPRPPFGKGANMAFRCEALERIGGFDNALGAGTPTRTAEDTAALSEVLLAGGTIVYQPSAIVHHQHRRDGGALDELMRGHGRGLAAFYTRTLLRRPSRAVELLRLAPMAVRDMFGSRRSSDSPDAPTLPAELRAAHRRGLLEGPGAYAIACVRARRLRQAHGHERSAFEVTPVEAPDLE